MRDDRRNSQPFDPSAILRGRAPCMRHVHRILSRLARVRAPVLIRGETGTGKELAARCLHDAGPRAHGPFVAINCGAIVAGLAESELFGHARGAFTGAHRRHAGAFARADGGTLFLDEVAELPLPIQATLLRVLETSRVTPVGSEAEQSVDVRVVAATHRDMAAEVGRGTVREDLYHRIGALEVGLPPLRDRPGDIPELLAYFVEAACAELGVTVIVSDDAIAAAVRHPWPGNVRALRNAVLRAAALADGPIGPRDLIPHASRAASPGATPGASAARDAPIVVPRGDYAAMNRSLLQAVLDEYPSVRQAAVALRIPRSTLDRWVKRDGLIVRPNRG